MRRFALIFSTVSTVLLAAALLLPWWLGAVLPLVGRPLGITFNGYARDGYGRFRLESFELRRANVLVRAQNIAAETPLRWAWHRLTGHPSAVIAGAWRTEVQRNSTVNPAKKVRGWVTLKRQLAAVARQLERWLPRATIGPGIVTWPGGELQFGPAEWVARTLDASEVRYRAMAAAAHVTIQRTGEIQLRLTTSDKSGDASLETAGAVVTGTGHWWGQPAELSARFGEMGWAPEDAILRAEKWNLSGAQVKLGAHYAVVRGDGRVEWKGGQLSADVSAEGVPLEHDRAPPLTVKLHAHGSPSHFVADQVEVNLPGVTARLSEPLTIETGGRLRSGTSSFVFAANLAQQPWVPALRGEVRGEGKIAPNAAGMAVVDFSLQGENIAAGKSDVTRFEATGKLEWPRLEIRQAKIVASDVRELNGSGSWDFSTQTVSGAAVRGTLEGNAVARWLPQWPKFQTLEIDATASGPWRTLNHAGSASVFGLEITGLKPLAASAKWRGHGFEVDHFDGEGQAGEMKVTAHGSADRARLNLTALTLGRKDGEELKLSQPAIVRWAPALEFDGVHLRGDDTVVDAKLRWAATGQIEVSGRHVSAEWLRELFVMPATTWTAESFSVQGNWDQGPATFSAEAALAIELGHDHQAHVSVRVRGASDGIHLESLRVAQGAGVIVDASGQFPIVVYPHRSPLLAMAGDAPFTLDAATTPNPEFWEKLTELSGVEVVKPEAVAHLRGSFAQPSGEVRLQVERLAAVPGRFKWTWPKIEKLDVQLTGSRGGVQLEHFAVLVQGQMLRAEGRLALPVDRWSELWRSPTRVLRKADLHVAATDVNMEAVADFFPAYLAPKGKMQLDLNFKSDASITGFLRVRDATSRPLGPLGVLQEINADLRLDGRTVNLETANARMGGQLVTLKGRAELPPEGPPELDLALTGKNLPFVRQTGLLLRGDLDLKLASSGRGATVISGTVRPRDSLFLSDVRSLIATGAKDAARRPPYFSIETEPLNHWRLDVAVEGSKFLQLRTPVFDGTASAHFRLSGTLGNPRASGEATIDDGRVLLPFASFDVRQGEVRITPDQADPELLVTGTSRRYGYDLRMEITGPASAPIVTFTSSPPLESEQVLLMIMAGQAPRNEVATTDRQRFARIGAYFGQSLLGSLGGGGGGADRLTISSGENISEQGHETYSIEYRLSDRWAVTGEYDEFDDYYGGLKWRIYQKGGKKGDGRQ